MKWQAELHISRFLFWTARRTADLRGMPSNISVRSGMLLAVYPQDAASVLEGPSAPSV
jgi:hypothetical protein